MNTIATLLNRLQAAQDDALEAAPHPSSKPFRAAKQALKNSFTALSSAIEGLGWILIETSMPDDDTLVLLALNDDDVWPGYRDGDTWRYVDAMPITAERVTHWMPLPAAPVRSAA